MNDCFGLSSQKIAAKVQRVIRNARKAAYVAVTEEIYDLDGETRSLLQTIPGPIAVFGAGGFIGFNLFLALRRLRGDVFAMTHDLNASWRLQWEHIGASNIELIYATNFLSTVTRLIIVIILFLEGLQLFAMSKIGEYISKIFEKTGFEVIDIINIRNTFSLFYWLTLTPLPMKRFLILALQCLCIKNMPISLHAGNIGIIARKT